MNLRRIVIVGGGSAGWLTAAILASQLRDRVEIELIESPDVATIGVGEGTWPSMRQTLHKIGVSEIEFLTTCDVSLKQGTKFVGWQVGKNEHYYHPFSLPIRFGEIDLFSAWGEFSNQDSFAHTTSPQPALCDLALAPKQAQTPEFAYAVNYGYHLNAGKFGDFLKLHCVDKLGVIHTVDHVVDVIVTEDGDIQSVVTKQSGLVSGDLFVDCTGMRGLLIGEQLGSKFRSIGDVLFNNRALATQVPHADVDSQIESTTVATAQEAGWIWDIGLSSRRGVGYVFSSDHLGSDAAEQTLRNYILKTTGASVDGSFECREIKFSPGYREQIWKNNCVAIGLSAGFVEPLEASALVLVERSAWALAEQLPPRKSLVPIVAKKFNQRFLDHWQSIVEFLKLHYVLSQREDPFWQQHRDLDTIPVRLSELLELWRYRPPTFIDAPKYDELFPAASIQYVLSGMGFAMDSDAVRTTGAAEQVTRAIHENSAKTAHLLKQMPTNRELLNHINRGAFKGRAIQK